MSMTREQYKGIFTIPVTPFKESGDVDVASLRRCIEFSVECGAHGLVGPVNASQLPSGLTAAAETVSPIIPAKATCCTPETVSIVRGRPTGGAVPAMSNCAGLILAEAIGE